MTDQIWFVVSNEEGTVLAVYGGALLSEAQETCRRIARQTGCRTVLHSGIWAYPDRPHVGQTISMKGAVTAWEP